jgi:hypothetical protein
MRVSSCSALSRKLLQALTAPSEVKSTRPRHRGRLDKHGLERSCIDTANHNSVSIHGLQPYAVFRRRILSAVAGTGPDMAMSDMQQDRLV